MREGLKGVPVSLCNAKTDKMIRGHCCKGMKLHKSSTGKLAYCQ